MLNIIAQSSMFVKGARFDKGAQRVLDCCHE